MSGGDADAEPASTRSLRSVVSQGQRSIPNGRPGSVVRTALIAHLDSFAAVPVVLIGAGAGSGKTTLVAQWVEHDPRPVAWLSASKEHDDYAVLVTDLLDALGAIESFDVRVRRRLTASGADLATVLLPRLARALAHRSEPFVLVIDDLHLVTRPEASAVVATLADHVPEGSQLVLVTRRPPAIPLARLHSSGRLASVDGSELAMVPAEASALLEGAGLSLDQSAVDALVERTEGWAAGLYLAALALREQPDPGLAASHFAGDDRLVADYLRDEVLRAFPRGSRDFLLRASVLDYLDGAVCDAVLERTDSGQMLERLARENLLVIPLDRTASSYRLHHLFADMLRSELHRRMPEAEVALHRRASRWFEGHDDLDSALAHAQAASDHDRIDDLIWRGAPAFLNSGRAGTVTRWLAPFSWDEIERRPALTVTAAWWAIVGNDVGRVRYLAAVASGAGPDAVLPDGTSVHTAAALLRAVVGQDGLRRQADDAGYAFTNDRVDGPYRSVAGFLEGAALRLLGLPDRARARLGEAAGLARVHLPASYCQCLSQLALLAVDEGRWSEARLLVGEAHAVIERYGLGERPAMAGMFAVSSLVRAQGGDRVRAEAAAEQSTLLLGGLADLGPWMVAQSHLVLGQSASFLSDVELARSHVVEAAVVIDRMPDFGLLGSQLDALRSRLGERRDTGGAASDMTPAELRVLRYLPTHFTLSAIADELGVSRNTVKSQAVSVYRKLGVGSRAGAVNEARRRGLVADPTGNEGSRFGEPR